jgi:2,4-dienoyl-CoA reductase-like NADH-dependent reductase (Old Yellow Enzyme family)
MLFHEHEKVPIKHCCLSIDHPRGESEADAVKLYSYLVGALDGLKIGYVQLAKHIADFDPEGRGIKHDFGPEFRALLKNALLFVNGGYSAETAETELQEGKADAVVFGRPFIANANLPEIFAKELELKWPDWTKLYGVHASDGSLICPAEGFMY